MVQKVIGSKPSWFIKHLENSLGQPSSKWTHVLNQGRTRQQQERKLITSLKNFDDIRLLFWLLSVTCHVH